MKKFIVTKQQLIDIFEHGFSCSAEGFNAEYGLKYSPNTDNRMLLIEHDVSLNDYGHNSDITYMEILENLISKFEVKND